MLRIGYDAKRLFHNTTGLGNYSRTLLETLAKYYPDHSYLLYNPTPQTIDSFQSTPPTKEVFPNSAFWKKFSALWRQGPITRQIKRSHLNIYHGLSGELPIGIKKTGVKTITTIHDLIFLRYPKLYNSIDRVIYLKKIKYATAHSDLIIAMSQQTKNDIMSFLKIPEDRIKVIYQGCYEAFKIPMSLEEQNNVLRKYKLPPHYILNVGTIEERKNSLSIVQAIKDIDISLVIIGNKTPYMDKVKRYVSNNGLERKVFFLHGLNTKALAGIYQSAKLFVYPSVFEGFGIPIIEAMYSKTPVITSCGSCFSEAGGPDSIYVEPYDVKTLSQQIDRLLQNKKCRDSQAQKSFDYVQRFDNKNMASSYMNLYLSLFNQA